MKKSAMRPTSGKRREAKIQTFVEVYIREENFDVDDAWLDAIREYSGTPFTFLIPWPTNLIPQVGTVLCNCDFFPLIEQLTVEQVEYFYSRLQGYQVHIKVDYPTDRGLRLDECGLVSLAEQGALCEDEKTTLAAAFKAAHIPATVEALKRKKAN